MKRFAVLSVAALAALPLVAQAPMADAADVASPEAIVTALYDVISGGAGVARNWDRLRSLFAPEGRLMPIGCNPQGQCRARVWTPEEYIQTAGAQLETNGFFEIETHNVTERFGNIVHVFSTYESRRAEADPEPFVRGINSIQLRYDGTRWWVVAVMWTDERSAGPIPERYLP
ncbi:MAG: hypothetical protein WD043_12475 [Gemmatimonadales bacterium]